MVDALYVVPRQEAGATQIENGISVQGLAVSGTSLFDYDWPAGARLCLYIAAAGMRRAGARTVQRRLPAALAAAREPQQ
jgi:hypothetical protein